MPKLIKKVAIRENKSFTNLYVVFDDGFEVQVKPSFDLTSKQYKKYMYEVNQLPFDEIRTDEFKK